MRSLSMRCLSRRSLPLRCLPMRCTPLSGILQCYLSLAFAVIVPITGSVAFSLYGSIPRRLLVEKINVYNRLIVAAEHMNTVGWIVFYGESI
jgi:hypothetical protein